MGLALVKGFVELHGGSVRVEGAGLGMWLRIHRSAPADKRSCFAGARFERAQHTERTLAANSHH